MSLAISKEEVAKLDHN